MPLKIHSIGGCSEVGKNCTLIQVDDEGVIIDMGLHMENYIKLTEDEDINNISIKQLTQAQAIPDIKQIKNTKCTIKGICLSHAHYDHIGAIPFLEKNFNTYIHGTAFTIEMLKIITKRAGKELKNKTTVHKENERFKISKNIEIEFIRVTHSIPQAVIIVVHTTYGKIMYVNDYKLDETPTLGKPTNYKRLQKLKGQIDVLMINTLYANKPGKTPSEKIAKQMLTDVLLQTETKDKAIIITAFASNIARIKAIMEVAPKLKRKIAFLGGSMAKYLKAATNTAIIRIPEKTIIGSSRGYIEKFLKRKDPKDYIYIVTGGQGEPKAVLSRIAQQEMAFRLLKDDIVIFSCNTIPVKNNMENRAILEKELESTGVRMFTEVHVSGHGAQEDYREFITTIKPKHLVPSHSTKEQIQAAYKVAQKYDYKLDKNFHILKPGDIFEVK